MLDIHVVTDEVEILAVHDTAGKEADEETQCSLASLPQPPLGRLFSYADHSPLDVVGAWNGDSLIAYLIVDPVDGKINWLVLVTDLNEQTGTQLVEIFRWMNVRYGPSWGDVENDAIREVFSSNNEFTVKDHRVRWVGP